MKFDYVHLKGAKCGLDIGDGSERGEYVCQDYILNTLRRPHRMVNIMYTYYPKDKQWPQRISEACKDMEVSFQWDYPYDDYFPFDIEKGTVFEQMRDIRKHGQDVLLTITADCSLEDEYLRKVAKSLKPFGRMCVRINHECNGTWFTHNQRYSFEEIGKFFVRFSKIIKEEAPQIRTIFCAGRVETTLPEEEKAYDPVTGHQKITQEDDFIECYKEADIISSDAYLSLHFGWPYDLAEAGDPNGRFFASAVENVYADYKATYERIIDIAGEKPLVQAELNSDGDVTGPIMQGDSVYRYYQLIKEKDEQVVNGLSMYQFRDRGRLGLEIEDPNCSSVGIKQPIMDDYKKILFDPYFYPEFEVTREGDEFDGLMKVTYYGQEAEENTADFKAELRWGSSEDADGIEIAIDLEKQPEFFEASLQKNLSIMMEVDGMWFYKAAGVETIDLMPAFFDKKLSGKSTVICRIFATPHDGENHDDGHEDYLSNYYTEMTKAPVFRIRYEAPGTVR